MEKQVDILIVGAGISGVGLAAHLSKSCPNRSFEIIERRESFGGTWDLFKYPVFVLIRTCQLLALILSRGKNLVCLLMGLRLKAIFLK
jgi:Predicted flavoprotein involved in K+ transport